MEYREMVEEMKIFFFKKYWDFVFLLDILGFEEQILDKDLVIVFKNVKYFK